MKSNPIVANFFGHQKQGITPALGPMPSHSSSSALISEGEILKQKEREPLTASSDHRSGDYGSDICSDISSQESKGYPIEYLSPTESLSSSLSSFRTSSIADQSLTASRKERNHLLEAMKTKATTSVLSSDSRAMVEISKVTELVEEELQAQRDKHKDQMNRIKAKFKGRTEKFENEIDKLRAERDEARRELEKSKRDQDSQKIAAERNERLQSEQKDRIESLEEQRLLVEELQKERDMLLDEVARTHNQQKKTKDELSALKVRVREDSEKRLSVMECLSTSWDAEINEAKQKEALLTNELDIMTRTLRAEKQFLKNKNKEFAQLESQYQYVKNELRSIRMKAIDEKDEMDEELRLERDALKRVVEEQKEILKLKNDEIYMAETAARSLKAELKVARENFTLKEESMSRSMKATKTNTERSDVADPEVKNLREENKRLNTEVQELKKQVESYLANMALQHEFCESLKSRIYKEQENEHEQVEEIHKLRKRIKKQQKEVIDKDLEIEQLKQLLDTYSASDGMAQTRTLKAGKKDGRRKTKSSSKGSGYRTS